MNVLDWDINDVFNDSTTQEVNWHRHMTRVDLAIDYCSHEFEGTAANRWLTRTKIEVWYQRIIDGLHGYDEQRRSRRAKLYA